MTTTMQLIAKQTVGAGGAASVTFSNIPQTYTDLKVVVSARNTSSAEIFDFGFNGVTTNQTSVYLNGSGSSATSGTYTLFGRSVQTGATASTFSNNEIYIANYTSSNNKSVSIDGVNENNATGAYASLVAGLWSSSAAITSITFTASFAEFSTFYLYGISNSTTTQATTVPYASGGDVITTDGSYWYHAFKYSGTFTPLKNLTADVLVVAGGGAGGGAWTNNSGTAAGGGAGGLRALTAQAFTSATSYTCTIGAGGTNTTNSATRGTNGGNSSIAGSGFTTISATGGGAGGGGDTAPNLGASGGSGGGTSQTSPTVTGGAGNAGGYTPVEGYAGGNATTTPGTNGSGGGGGAGAVGGNGASASGAGGIGFTSSLTNAMGAATVTGQLSSSNYYYAGGGGGGGSATPTSPGAGGLGGGGAGGAFAGDGVTGTANTGGGGGSMGASNSSGTRVAGNGGSGIIIVRYAV